MRTIIIGNLISLVAAGFLAAACIVRDRKTVFFLQAMECTVFTIASIVLGSFSGAASALISALRNLTVSRGKFTKPVMWFFLIATVSLGLAVNSRGLLGLMPVAATVQFTLCSYYVTGVRSTRYSIVVNLLIWVIYSFLICDFATAVCDGAVMLIGIAEIWNTRHENF